MLPKRYLWALGEGVSAYQPGSMLAERYLCKRARIFLDTKPGLLSSTYQELPEVYLPYLRLVAYPLHVPQVYDWIPASPLGQEIILLDHASLGRFGQVNAASLSAQPFGQASGQASGQADPLETELLPSIATQWQQATELRQLNWLWQMANLWQPLNSERATASLLDAENLRIDSTLIRLLELRFDAQPHGLADLGQFWLMWAELAQPQLKEFMTQLCQGLIDGQIYNAELLVGALDQAIAQIHQEALRSRNSVDPAKQCQIHWATLSDQGPTRQRNEDACYPVSGSHASSDPALPTLLIVCDGIGGHQGGDVASNLAIASLEQQVKSLAIDQMDPVELTIALEKAVCVANDQISQQNDSEQRFERQRMGTTVVMVLVHDHELYITHIGDSRVYWMTRWGCYQLTLDDDVASREVRLGYSFYRQALHQPSAGSLVQALGMSASSMLYPNVQRLIPAEPGILLLCSDGLSDNERVEEAWETDIRPLLEQAIQLNDLDLATLSQQLVEIGNSRNGYDNVTVALLYYHPVQPTTAIKLPVLLADVPSPPPQREQATELVAPALEPMPEPLPAETSGRKFLPLMGLGIGIVGLAGLLAALLPVLRPASRGLSPEVTSSPTAPLTSLDVGSLIELTPAANPPALVARPPQSMPPQSELPQPVSPQPVLPQPVLPQPSPPQSELPQPVPPQPVSPQPTAPALSPTPASPAALDPEIIGVIPPGTLLEVLRKQNQSQQESWVELRVCSVPNSSVPNSSVSSSPVPGLGLSPAPVSSPAAGAMSGSAGGVTLQAGQTGWMREQEILPLAIPRANLSAEQQQACS
ncbi:MAG: protein phosphatase 2C domain-containing protein [Elainella sp.]